MAIADDETLAQLIRRADAEYRGFPDFEKWVSRGVDLAAWQSALEAFESEKRHASRESLQRALDFALRAAAIDTGAIEGLYQVDRGFTFSIAAQAASWQSDLDEKGPHVRRLFEAQLAGLELVIDAVTSAAQISESWIRRLHEVLCDAQKTYRVRTAVGWQDQDLPKGIYKAHPNHVLLADRTVHSYSPVDRTSDEMSRLVSELRSVAFQQAHPVLQAAYSHYALVAVHPFADGNGRVARALASVFTYRACSIPLVVYAEQKARYLEALAAADAGRFDAFTTFVLGATVDTMNELALRMRQARVMSVQEAAGGMERHYARAKPSTSHELDRVARRIAGELRDEIERVLNSTTLPVPVTFEVKLTRSVDPPNDSGFRRVGDGEASVALVIRSVEPPLAVARRYQVAVASDANAFYAMQVEQPCSPDVEYDALRVRLDLVHPSLSESFRRQLESWVRVRVGELLSDLEKRATASVTRPLRS
ncbi:MAG: Fic family protein [Thermodesulfobacteriota bacterium]